MLVNTDAEKMKIIMRKYLSHTKDKLESVNRMNALL